RLRLAQDQSGDTQVVEEFRKRGVGRIALYFFGAVVAIWLVIPMLVVIPMSLTAYTSLAFPPQALSFHWYSNLFNDPEWREAARHTLEIGLATTIVSTVVGTAAAIGMSRGRVPMRP